MTLERININEMTLEQKRDIRRLYEDGVSPRMIARVLQEKHNIFPSEYAIREILKEAKVPMRDQKDAHREYQSKKKIYYTGRGGRFAHIK